jgi:hypothetical protein
MSLIFRHQNIELKTNLYTNLQYKFSNEILGKIEKFTYKRLSRMLAQIYLNVRRI